MTYLPPGGQPDPYQSAQPYGHGYAPLPGRPTNLMAILALVFSFLFPPAGAVLGHIARGQIRQTGEDGEGIATAGLWISYIHMGLWLLGCGAMLLFYAGLFAYAASTSTV